MKNQISIDITIYELNKINWQFNYFILERNCQLVIRHFLNQNRVFWFDIKRQFNRFWNNWHLSNINLHLIQVCDDWNYPHYSGWVMTSPFAHFRVQHRVLAKIVAVKTDRRDWQKATGNGQLGLTNKAVSWPGNSLFPGRLLRAHKIQINDKTSRTTTTRTTLPATFAFHCQNANLATGKAECCCGAVLTFYGL